MARQIDETKIVRLMQTAIELINRQGYSATTISQIAKAAGISTGYLYRHFSGKEELVQAIYDDAVGALDDRIDSLIKTHTVVRHVVEGFITLVYQRANEDPELVEFICLMLYEQAFNIPKKREKKTNQQSRQLLKMGIASGEIDKCITVEDISITIFSIPFKLIERRSKPKNKKNQYSKKDVEKVTRLCMNAVK